MPSRKGTLPIVAGLALLAIVWFAFRDNHAHAPAPKAVPVIHAAASAAPIAATREVALVPKAGAPWTMPAASAVDATRCGQDERPLAASVDASGIETQARDAGPHYAADRRRLIDALSTSADPFDRAVEIWLNLDEANTMDQRRLLLARDAASTSDPRIYALAFTACGYDSAPGRPCALLDARKWASLDAGNAIPWIYLLKRAQIANDVSGQQEALMRLATAVRVDDRRYTPIGAALDRISTEDPDTALIFDVATASLGWTAAQYFPFDALLQACRNRAGGDANVAQQCDQIGRRLFDRADAIEMRQYGSRLVQMATGDDRLRKIAAHDVNIFSAGASMEKYSQCSGMRELVREVRIAARLGAMGIVRDRERRGVVIPPSASESGH